LLQNGSLFAFLSFNIYFFHCKFTNSISLSVCRCKSKVVANEKIHAKLRKSAQTAKYFASAPASATVDDDGGRNPGWLFPPARAF
jgi:hypothetical protein